MGESPHLIGSHNSAISLAYGYGIEQDGFEKLLNKTYYDSDDLGEGVCQSFSLTDQLEMGLRHLEIDITAAYYKFPPKPTEINVCHSPVPLDPKVVAQVELAAHQQHVDLKWQPKNLSCLGTSVPMVAMLGEVKSWLDAHPTEFAVLYLDTKPLTVTTKAQADAVSKDIRAQLGDAVWVPADGNVLNQSVSSLLARGKRVYVEDHEDAYNTASDVTVYAQSLWTHQFADGDLQPFPSCAVRRAERTLPGLDAEPKLPLTSFCFLARTDQR